MKIKPNLFDFATSELTQDAFIAWLLSWADCENDVSLRKSALFFIKKMTNDAITEVFEIDVKKQVKTDNGGSIDILCKVNNNSIILIEDKTNTSETSGQLEKYSKWISEDVKFKNHKLYPIYFKTKDQSNLKNVVGADYVPFLRSNIIEMLKYCIDNYNVTNAIFLDFYEYLTNIEKNVNSYKITNKDNWNSANWIGFYSEIQNVFNNLKGKFEKSNWHYVPQRNGGFMALTWAWLSKEIDGDTFNYYLQLEQTKLCFKIIPKDPNNARKIRDKYRKLLYSNAKENGIEIKQNGRVGKSMTVAILKNSYIAADENGIVDMPETIQLLTKVTNLITSL